MKGERHLRAALAKTPINVDNLPSRSFFDAVLQSYLAAGPLVEVKGNTWRWMRHARNRVRGGLRVVGCELVPARNLNLQNLQTCELMDYVLECEKAAIAPLDQALRHLEAEAMKWRGEQCIVPDWLPGRAVDERRLSFQADDQGRLYLRTFDLRWLIALPDSFPESWEQEEIVHDAAMLLEDIWLLRHELMRHKGCRLDNVMFLSMEIGKGCERLAHRRFIELFAGKRLHHENKARHRASVQSKQAEQEKRNREIVGMVEAALRRPGVSLTQACSRVAKKTGWNPRLQSTGFEPRQPKPPGAISPRRIHQIYREHVPVDRKRLI